ncbi:MAG: ABC transporter ATP-binding protein/permease [Gammaproteobacteria bacterium]|nr:ABC transporter ATP-binding protein/permease [Gammaproteobacteria bacterium]
MHFTPHTENPQGSRRDRQNLQKMFPYIWEYRGRVIFALICLVVAKLATVGVPFILKKIVDDLNLPQNNLLVLPLLLLLGYGALKLVGSLFNELRDAVFARVRYRAMRRIADAVLEHLHVLSLRYHLEKRTGGVARDLERGTSSVSTILNYMVFNILPSLAEFILVAVLLLGGYEPRFTLAVFATVVLYFIFTFWMTEWRMHFRHEMNTLDSKANAQAIDSLINYETVKYFNNEKLEMRQYDATMTDWENVAVKTQTSMALLNFGQASIIAIGVTLIMVFAGQGVVAGTMSLGDLVLINTLMLQLFIPLGFLGIVYRQLKYALADMDMLFKLLERSPEISDAKDAVGLQIRQGHVRFEQVSFYYQAERPILNNVSFEIPPGHKVAVVGPSGAGKSTLARLLFRFYDIQTGKIFIDDQDIAQVTQDSLRRAIGMVPQDTVLFNDTIYYNIHYAQPEAGRSEVVQAAKLAHIHEFIQRLPQGYDTLVGERGLKLSGGEKQRMAIARVILKNPKILIFDEATSNLDSQSEQAILKSLEEIAVSHTTLVIAHRLSTIVDADRIYVLDHGQITEEGTHTQLLAHKGLYAKLWHLQQEERQRQSVVPASVSAGATTHYN